MKNQKKYFIKRILTLCVAMTSAISAYCDNSMPNNNVRPKLVVGITIEGLSNDYIDLLKDCLSDSGFNFVIDKALTISNIDYGTPLDATACNAIIHTGAAPMINGIPSSGYFQPLTKRVVPVLNSESPSAADESYSPKRLLSSTLSDELKIESAGIGRIYSIAPDASMAIIAGGHAANSVYWINDVSGKWTTSTYYSERPVFLQYRNRMRPISSRLDTLTWTPSVQPSLYPGIPSIRKSYPFSVRFPYGYTNRYPRYKSSPVVNDEVTEVATEFIKNMGLGNNEDTDMLCVTYTLQPFPYGNSNDEKMQIMDGYIRLDKNLMTLLTAINEGPGLANTLLFIAGTPLNSTARKDDEKWRLPGGEFSVKKATSLLNLYLINKFGNGDWIIGYHNGFFYLNPSTISDHNVDAGIVRKEGADFLKRMAGVSYAYSIDEIADRKVLDNAAAHSRNIRYDAVGDINITISPGWRIKNEDNDNEELSLSQRFVQPLAPAFILYPSIEKNKIEEPVDARSIAPTIASVLKIRPPNGASLPPLQLK